LIRIKTRRLRCANVFSVEEMQMPKLKIDQGDWVVVCDGKKALLLVNAGDAKFLNLKTREVLEHADLKTHELGTDAPGRSFSSVGHGRSAVEQTDWHTQEEHRFLHKLAGRLDAAVNAGEAKSIVIVAPPRALGVLRQTYSHNLRAVLRGEVDKDLVKLPIHEIEKHLGSE
jgi:protein required for attachment to host cells